jgi:hypothetical protein
MSPSESESEAAVALLGEEFLFDEFQTDRDDDRKICLECGHEIEIRDAYGDETFAVGHYGCSRCRSWTLGVADPEGRLTSEEEATELFAAVSGFEWPGSR